MGVKEIKKQLIYKFFGTFSLICLSFISLGQCAAGETPGAAEISFNTGAITNYATKNASLPSDHIALCWCDVYEINVISDPDSLPDPIAFVPGPGQSMPVHGFQFYAEAGPTSGFEQSIGDPNLGLNDAINSPNFNALPYVQNKDFFGFHSINTIDVSDPHPSTIVFRAFTFDISGSDWASVPGSPSSNAADADSDGCYDFGDDVLKVSYLDSITTTTTIVDPPSCEEPGKVWVRLKIEGGFPELFDNHSYGYGDIAWYNLTSSADGYLDTNVVEDHGGEVLIKGLAPGATYSINIADNNGCLKTVSGTIPLSVNVAPDPNIIALTGLCAGASPATLTADSSNGTWSAPLGSNYLVSANQFDPGLAGCGDHLIYHSVTSAGVTCLDTALITVLCPKIDSIIVTDPSCFNGNNGTIIVYSSDTISDGITISGGPYSNNSFTFPDAPSSGKVSFGFIENDPDSFSISLTSSSCSGSSLDTTFFVDQPTLLVVDTLIENIKCKGETNGKITLTSSGGTPPYSYAWAEGATPLSETSNILNNLSAGTYSATITDNNGCDSVISNIIIDEPSTLLTIDSLVKTEIKCFGDLNGEISTYVSGGSPTYVYQWTNAINSNNQNLNGLGAGTYDLKVTDQRGCEKTQSISLTTPSVALSLTPSPTNITCNGLDDGKAAASVVGGEPSYTFQWDASVAPANQNDSLLTNLQANTYSLTVTDARGCEKNTSVDVTEPSAIVISKIIDPMTCNGDTDASISISVSGGTGSYSYNWNTCPTCTDNISSISAGSYSVTVTDQNSCVVDSSYTLVDPPVLSITTLIDSTSCIDGNDGKAIVQATGGNTATSDYNYNWGPSYPINNDTLNGLQAGKYPVTVTDNYGCAITDSAVVENPPTIIIVIEDDSLSCFQSNDGKGTAILSNDGIAPFTYQWQDANSQTLSETDSILDGTVSAGWYSLTVTDGSILACEFTDSVFIGEPQVLSFDSLNFKNTICPLNNGEIEVFASGGTPFSNTYNDYTFEWTDLALNNYSGFKIENLRGETYTLELKDQNNCQLDTTIEITETVVLDITSNTTVKQVRCNGEANGQIKFNPTNGNPTFTYNWSANAPAGTNGLALNLTADTYDVTITDNDGCSKDTSITISQPPVLAFVVSQAQGVSCFDSCDGSSTILATGGVQPYKVDWTNSGAFSGNFLVDTTYNDFCGGFHPISIEDDSGCTASATTTIYEPSKLIFDNFAFTNPTCHNYSDGTIIAGESGGTSPYTYNWSNNASTPSISSLQADTFSTTITDKNGCVIDTGVTLLNPEKIKVHLNPIAVFQDTCDQEKGQIIIDSVSGAGSTYSFLWDNNALNQTAQNPINLNGPQTYSVTVTDNFNCFIDTSIFVDELLGPQITSLTATSVSCFDSTDGSTMVQVTGGSPFLSGTDYTYSWQSGSNSDTASSLAAGVYGLVVLDRFDCRIDTTIEVPSPLEVIANVNMFESIICEDSIGNLIVQGSDGVGSYAYEWMSGQNSQQISLNLGRTDTLIARVIDQSGLGCASKWDTLIPNFYDTTNLVLIADTQICDGTTLNLTALTTGGNTSINPTFNWSNGDQSAEFSETPSSYPMPSTYYVTASRGCESVIDSIFVEFFNNPVVNFSADVTEGCAPLEVNFTNNTQNTDSCSWNFGNGETSSFTCAPFVFYNTEGCHDVTLTIYTTDGCAVTQTDSCKIDVYDIPVADFRFNPDSSTVIDPEIEFVDLSSSAGDAANISNWQWVFNQTDTLLGIQNPTYFFPGEAGSYPVQLTVTDFKGCKQTKDTTFRVVDVFKMFVPNAFTPGGICDGINDQFCPTIIGLGDFYEFRIYNRWGEKVFESFDINNCWDGSLSNWLGAGSAQPDTYTWIIRARSMVTNQTVTRTGTVLLLR